MNNKIDEKLVERLVGRIEELNTNILKKIGKTIKEIKNLTPTQAHQLQTILKYGNNYKDIVNKIAKTTNLNIDEIDNIFSAYAKQDYAFAKDFYDYKGLTYKSYKDFELLNRQVNALSRITKQGCLEIAKTKALGYTITDLNGNVKFKQLKDAYQYAIDQAILSVSQGKDTFDNQMYGILRDLGGGLKTIDYESGRTRRLDSALRMNIQDGLRDLHNETQKVIGEDFGADGVEITVHESPAPDHADLQGRQFSTVKPNKNKLSEFEKLQNNEPATDYKGVTYTHEHRPISQYNCYHTTFAILLGVNNPQYSDEQLKQIKTRNEKGFEFEGKHYTMYEGTQLQRRIETEIRKQKDTQILARESDNKQLIGDSQYKITQLTGKYKELSKASGLSMKQDRLRVSGYKRVKVEINKPKIETIIKERKNPYEFVVSKEKQLEVYNIRQKSLKSKIKQEKINIADNKQLAKQRGMNNYIQSRIDVSKRQIDKYTKELEELGEGKFEDKTIVLKDFESCKELLATANINLEDDMEVFDKDLLIENTAQLYRLNEKYPIVAKSVAEKRLNVMASNLSERTYARTTGRYLEYNNKYFKDKEKLISNQNYDAKINWHYEVAEDYTPIYTTTHEFGHILQERYKETYNATRNYSTQKDWKSFDSMVMEGVYDEAKRRTKLKITELKSQFLTDYGDSKRNYEAFAEIFAGMELGIKNPLTEALEDYLEVMNKWM